MNTIEVVKFIVNNVISKLNRHKFFKDRDMREWMPFIAYALYEKGIYVHPVGKSWCSETTKENAEKYIDDNEQLFEEYGKWCEAQR